MVTEFMQLQVPKCVGRIDRLVWDKWECPELREEKSSDPARVGRPMLIAGRTSLPE